VDVGGEASFSPNSRAAISLPATRRAMSPRLSNLFDLCSVSMSPNSKPVQWRWFGRADKQPFFFAGIWRPWTGDRGTKKAPNIGDHTLFSIMTTEPNEIVEPIHEKAMPVMLMTPDDVEQWLRGSSVEDALKMQKPAPDEAIVTGPDRKAA
jgi:putative SOS response-associated peptidase YedK